MEDRIRRALINVRKQKYPLVDALQSSYVCDEQISSLLKDFWTPSEILEQTCDRIRSSSMDDPEPPVPPEQEAMAELKEECGQDICNIIHAVSVLNDSVEIKCIELRQIEDELRESERTMNHYNSLIQSFKSGVQELSFPIEISGQEMFLESLNHSIYQEMKRKDIPSKLRRFQYLLCQIQAISKLPKMTSGSMPQCNICYTSNTSCALVPCGHMYCDNCISNISHENKCFTCRKRSTRILKLFPM